MPRSRQYLSPGRSPSRSRSGSPFSRHSVSSQASNVTTYSVTSEYGDHTKSRRLNVSRNGKVEIHKFDTIQQKLKWIKENQHKYPSLKNIEIICHHSQEPTESSTADQIRGTGGGVDHHAAESMTPPAKGNTYINNYHYNDTYHVDARAYSPHLSIEGVDVSQLPEIRYNGRGEDDWPAALPAPRPRRPLLPSNNNGGTALPWWNNRQPHHDGNRR